MDVEQRDYVVLDVFTSKPLEGNALAVFPDGRRLDATLMQRAARELHLSETVFVLDGDADCDARLRIFTPAAEVPFAGHPVLGAACLLAERHGLRRVRLRTGSGVIALDVEQRDGDVLYGEMVAPIPTLSPFGPVSELLEALGVERVGLPVELYDNGLKHVCVMVESERAVAGVAPDFGALTRLGEICVSCFTGFGDRCKTRMFAPALGVAEDPATGSAAGPVALHLARGGRAAFGQRITISQGAEIGRPSTLFAQVDGTDERLERITVGGEAVRVAQGTYRLQ